MPNLNLIPDARLDAVREAIQSAFGNHKPLDLQPIGGGVSGATILRFSLLGRPYVLRLEPERVALPDRERGFACMSTAAAAGAAPRVHYADPVTGVAIMDFVAGRPMATFPGGATALAKALGTLVANVQATALFPSLGDYPDAIATLLVALRSSPLLAVGNLEPHAEGLALIRSALPWHSEALVSSHNDPNPRNLIFDGDRLWLVDWELAFRNDPLVDIAILTTEFAGTPDLEDLLLEATLGVKPDRHLRARLEVIGLLTRLFYGCVVLDSLRSTSLAGFVTLEPYTPSDFRRAAADGRLATGTPEIAHAFARMSFRAFMDGVNAPGFVEVLEIVRQG